MERNDEYFDSVFDKVYTTETSLDQLIENLKKEGLSQGESHFLISRRLRGQYSFWEVRRYIVHAPCWSESLAQNNALDDEFSNFFQNEEGD
ncbi:hypothetical protein DRF65_24140 [Chryseobacterium pennae]|uniref:Uncharacterized protein n=1 Tax=Chryseobacterium pennae TaxID=2258962 RepID=A0A3D9C1T2_9FLAO|nr:hypothetical protein [Chryseobacterium pennae]REC59820.1 hypothetical protein DRF65_24140 [Chryseobacterium pennae]